MHHVCKRLHSKHVFFTHYYGEGFLPYLISTTILSPRVHRVEKTILIHPQMITLNSSIHTPALTPETLIKGPWILSFILILVETKQLVITMQFVYFFPCLKKTKEEYFKCLQCNQSYYKRTKWPHLYSRTHDY